jgi:hypothetical protein
MQNEERIRELLGRLPHPDGEIPDGASDEMLANFTKRTGTTLPLAVEELLKLSNAPYIDSQVLLGVSDEEHRDIESTYMLFPSWKERGWIPIGADGSGNYYVVPTKEEFGEGHPVLFVEAVIDPDIPAYIVASDVAHFVLFLIERELKMSKWPFDRDDLLARDPNIRNYRGVSLP